MSTSSSAHHTSAHHTSAHHTSARHTSAEAVWLDTWRTPLLVLAVNATASTVVLTEIGDTPALTDRYHAAFLAVTGLAVVLLAVGIALGRPARRPRALAAVTWVASTIAAVLAVNGMVDGTARWTIGAAALAAFAVSVAALLADFRGSAPQAGRDTAP